MALSQEKSYTLEAIYALPDGQRCELIDGHIYQMSPPNTMHQKISWKLHQEIGNYISAKRRSCDIYAAPFAVFLNNDDRNYVEPDLSVICDRSKLTDKGCSGAPDWIIEIVSPSTQQIDYGLKLFKYRTAGVREYWIVNPMQHTVIVYDFEQEKETKQYSFNDTIPVCIYKDFSINIAHLL